MMSARWRARGRARRALAGAGLGGVDRRGARSLPRSLREKQRAEANRVSSADRRQDEAKPATERRPGDARVRRGRGDRRLRRPPRLAAPDGVPATPFVGFEPCSTDPSADERLAADNASRHVRHVAGQARQRRQRRGHRGSALGSRPLVQARHGTGQERQLPSALPARQARARPSAHRASGRQLRGRHDPGRLTPGRGNRKWSVPGSNR